MADRQSAYQKPIKLSLSLNAKKQPIGNETHQYAIRLANITTFVFFKPLKMPDKVTCRPSNIWKQHSTYTMGTHTFTNSASGVNSLIKNSGINPITVAEQAINIIEMQMPV